MPPTTIGIMLVACLAARAGDVLITTMTSTWSRTAGGCQAWSFAGLGARSYEAAHDQVAVRVRHSSKRTLACNKSGVPNPSVKQL